MNCKLVENVYRKLPEIFFDGGVDSNTLFLIAYEVPRL